ncbi:uncharacterized protein LOC110731419 [Chenopodium quinoa]|uniref:uncharacterized protein LOC110731419 n=1 Tax=Chenopodium quinoa TaxID=63459 RepID=UPI000B78C13C|nr:uncharacterized protein LOC110731419 [Chenopodium quinoa]
MLILLFNSLRKLVQQSDIRIIVCHEPLILVSRVSKTLKPKIKLLNDIGLFGSDLVETVVWNPSMLRQRLGPAIDAFRTILGSDQNVVRVMKRSGWIQFDKASYYLIPNAELLQSYCGISGKKIQKYIIHQPGVFSMKTDLFRKNLIRVEKKLGIPRDSKMFFYGIQSVAICSDKNIDDKCEIFRSFGWTQSNVKDLIRRHPLCLTLKKEIIKEKLDFLINQLGYKPACPAFQSLFSCSIEKRLLPRHRVLQVLKEKRLIKKHYRLSGASVLTEAHFLKKFVLPFEEVHGVYAQLTGSTVESLIVKGQTLKMRSRSNAASCKSAHKLAGVRRCSKHGPLTGRRHVTGSCWNWSIVLTFHLLEYCMFSLIVSQYIG